MNITSLTGLPSAPKWLYRLFLRFPKIVPSKIKWKIASKGVGLLVNNLDRANNPAESLKELGRKQGRAIAQELGFGKTVREVMQVTVLANRLFGTKSSIVSSNGSLGKTLITRCAWAGKDWGPKPCALLSCYEKGLVEGLNPNVQTRYLKKISNGDDCCITSYEMRDSDASNR